MSTKSPSRTADQFVVRLPEGMRERIAEFAKQNNRSMNAEIVQRLEWAMSIVDWKKEENDRPPPPQQPIAGALSWLMTDEINRAAVAKGVPFDEMFAQIVLAGLYPTAPQVFYIAQLPGATKEDMRAALEASKGIVREDAALIVERFEKAPWAPEWMLERMRDSVDLTVVKENKVIFVQTKSTSPLPSSEQVKPRRVVRTVPKKTKAE